MVRTPCKAALLVPLVSILLSAPASAQRGGTLELVPLARYSFFADSLLLTNGLGVGAEVGLFVTRHLSLELEGNYVVSNLPDSASVTASGRHARLLVHLPLQGNATALFGVGYAGRQYGRGLDQKQEGPGGLIGLRFGLGPRLGLRFDATADYMSTPGSGAGSQWDLGAQAGMSIYAARMGPRDGDRDGVPDEDDRCAGTPPGQPVDPTGCPLPRDSDDDGVLDGVDRCPGTVPGQRVDPTGCNADLDGDGVANALDRCPATPAGAAVDQFGCPPPAPPADSDGDRVPDDGDRCPGTSPGVRVDALGCAVPVTAPAPPAPRLILRDVTFTTGSATLTSAAESSLRSTASSLLLQPGVRLEVAGYTDDTGSRTNNERLSFERARAVRAFLVSAGVPADQLTARGYGPADPVATNVTAAGRALNRRVELRPAE
jgi:OOP family OmpA-OmpF porin